MATNKIHLTGYARKMLGIDQKPPTASRPMLWECRTQHPGGCIIVTSHATLHLAERERKYQAGQGRDAEVYRAGATQPEAVTQ